MVFMIYAMFRYLHASITCQYVSASITCQYVSASITCQCVSTSITCQYVTCKYHMSVCHVQVSVCKTVFYGIILVINPIYLSHHTTPNSYEDLENVVFVSVCSAPSSDQTDNQSLALLALHLYHAQSVG